VARWLAAHGAREIILLSRRRPAELPAMDAPVRFYEGDVSDEALIASVFEDNPEIEGVVHAAGVLADAPLDGQTRETIDTVVHAKIGGA
jgi:polyketide synthase 12